MDRAGHHRNHQRLRDRLIEANRARPVQIGILLDLDRNKLLSRYFGHRLENSVVKCFCQFTLDQAGGFFITRAKRNLDARCVYSAPVDRDTELICDQTIALNGFYAAKYYPAYLRRIRYRDPETGKNLVFLTNQFALPALTICALYRCRWQVELFFKWIKQHLRIKRFYGTSENAVRTQIWIAISVYVLVAIIKKKLRLNVSLHTLLQILSLTLFEKLPLKQAVAGVEPIETNPAFYRQLNLFEF